MDIRRLRYFLQVAEVGSINATAELVNLSQPSLSRQIRLLEEELGVELFIRRRDGMALSREGLELRMRILGPLRQLELALDDTKAHSSQVGGTVVLGMPSSAIYALASPLAQRAADFPKMTLHIVEGHAGQMLKQLERGEIDVALLNAPPAGANWRCEIEDLLVEHLMLVGPSMAALKPDRPVTPAEMADLPLILPSPANHPPPLRELVEALSAIAPGRVNFPLHADTVQLTKSYMEAGLGYSIFPYSAISREAERGELTFAPIDDPRMKRHTVLGIHPAARYPRALARLKDLIRTEVVELAGRDRWGAQILF